MRAWLGERSANEKAAKAHHSGYRGEGSGTADREREAAVVVVCEMTCSWRREIVSLLCAVAVVGTEQKVETGMNVWKSTGNGNEMSWCVSVYVKKGNLKER